MKIFPHSKKGMEVWQLVLLILAIVLLVLVIMWYGGLNKQLPDLFEKLIGVV